MVRKEERIIENTDKLRRKPIEEKEKKELQFKTKIKEQFIQVKPGNKKQD